MICFRYIEIPYRDTCKIDISLTRNCVEYYNQSKINFRMPMQTLCVTFHYVGLVFRLQRIVIIYTFMSIFPNAQCTCQPYRCLQHSAVTRGTL